MERLRGYRWSDREQKRWRRVKDEMFAEPRRTQKVRDGLEGARGIRGYLGLQAMMNKTVHDDSPF